MNRIVMGTAVVVALAGCASTGQSYSGTYGNPSAYDYSYSPPTSRDDVSPATLSPEQVRLIQRSLAQRGMALDVNGTFDDRTRTALLEFQRAQTLPQSGKLDGPTLKELGIDPRDVTPVRGPAEQEPNVDVERVHSDGG